MYYILALYILIKQTPSQPLSPQPLQPLRQKNVVPPLSSGEINKASLQSPEGLIREKQRAGAITEKTAPTIAQMLAQKAIFGPEIMARCTPQGTRADPALPRAELYILKKIIFKLFPIYSNQPQAFEKLWKRCMTSIEQACKRARKNTE